MKVFEKKIDEILSLMQESDECADFLELLGMNCSKFGTCSNCGDFMKKEFLKEYIPKPDWHWDFAELSEEEEENE